MGLRHRHLRAFLVVALAALVLLAQSHAPQAKANVACDLGTSPAGAVTGGIDAVTGGLIGGGNPVGDACNSVTDGAVSAVTAPIGEAVEGIGNGIFNQITDWVAGGASWLIGQVATLTNKTTTPQLTTKGFVSQYRKMAEIAVFLAAAMLLFAVLEGAAQGSTELLARVVFVNLPLAFIASSVAYLVVQMLITATDGLSHAVAVSADKNSEQFFRSAIHGLSQAGGAAGAVGGSAAGGPGAGTAVGGAGGATAVPLFVTFLAAIIGAFAAFFVWIELLMRDAAVYVVALFAPMALAASIWPRWSGAMRRTAELLAVVIGSKFVIVSIIALAAGLASQSGGGVEHILAAAALMLLASFSPFVLFKLVPFAEGAMAAAYGRRSASGGAASGFQLANSAQIMRNTARANWGSKASGASPGVGSGSSGGGGAGRPGGPPGAAGASSSSGVGAAAGSGAASAGAGPAAAAAPVAVGRAGKGAAQRLASSGVAEASASGSEGAASRRAPSSGAGSAGSSRPGARESASKGEAGDGSQPAEAAGGKAHPAGGEVPRPAPEVKGSRPTEKGKR